MKCSRNVGKLAGAEDRNHATAALYDALGLAEYEGIEGFVRWKGDVDSV